MEQKKLLPEDVGGGGMIFSTFLEEGCEGGSIISAGRKTGVDGSRNGSASSSTISSIVTVVIDRGAGIRWVDGRPLPFKVAFFCFFGGEGARSGSFISSASSTSIESILTDPFCIRCAGGLERLLP